MKWKKKMKPGVKDAEKRVKSRINTLEGGVEEKISINPLKGKVFFRQLPSIKWSYSFAKVIDSNLTV